MLSQLKNKTQPGERRSRSDSPSARLKAAAAGGGVSISRDAANVGKERERSGSPNSRLPAGRRPRSNSPSSRIPGRICRSASPSGRLRSEMGGQKAFPSARGRSGSPSDRLKRARELGHSFRLLPLRSRSGSVDARPLPPRRSRSMSPSAKLRAPPGRSRSMSSSSQLLRAPRGRSASPSRGLTMNGEMDRSETHEKGENSGSLLLPPIVRKVCGYLAPISLLLLSSVGLVIATGNVARFTPNFLEDLIPTLKNNEVVDPYSAKEGETTYAKWDNGGQSGLKLEVLNAMSDSWQVWFSLAVADWEYGNPDALTLPVTRVAEDKECKEVQGKLKVCNGDYGETKWRGINAATRDDTGFIIASTARMNEFYLNFDAEGAKQYTLCHEMGHGFGLTHTDESFDNPDLGNCLDYTNNFNANKHPDVSLYESLLGLYGPASGRRLLRAQPPEIRERALSQSLWDKIHDAVEKLTRRLDDNAHEDGWKLLHRSRHGEDHELELEGGYNVRVNLLLA